MAYHAPSDMIWHRSGRKRTWRGREMVSCSLERGAHEPEGATGCKGTQEGVHAWGVPERHGPSAGVRPRSVAGRNDLCE